MLAVSGYSINTLTLFGLVLSIGLLVGAVSLTTVHLPDFDDRPGAGMRRGRGGGGGGGGRPDPLGFQVDGLQLASVATMVLALAFRRTAPRAAFLGTVVATALFLLSGGPYGLVLLGPALSVHTVMTRLPPRQLVALLG